MLIIYPSHSDYLQIHYPAGEQQIRLTENTMLRLAREKTPVTIVAYIKSAEDLIGLALLKDAIDMFRGVPGVVNSTLMLPYLPYGRADRRFVKGDCHGIAVFAELINAMKFERVVTLDAHSSMAKNYIDGLIDMSPIRYIEAAISMFGKQTGASRICILYSDEGAATRYEIGKHVGSNVQLFETFALKCKKRRDPSTGQFLGFEVPEVDKFEGCPAIIIDDICDGGGTFIGIWDSLYSKFQQSLSHANQPMPQIGLYVTHGIFSKGYDRLCQCFDHIYTTDSFPPPEVPLQFRDNISRIHAVVPTLQRVPNIT